MVTYQSYMPQLLQALSQKAQQNEQERIAAEERERAGQFNAPGMLGGLLTGAVQSGMLDKLAATDWGKMFQGKEAVAGAPISLEQARTVKGVRTGSLPGYTPIETEGGTRYVPQGSNVPVNAGTPAEGPNPLGFLKDALGGIDFSKLATKEAVMGGAAGGIQPVNNSPKDIVAGMVAGQQMSQTMKESEAKLVKEVLDKREKVLDNFDLVDPSSEGAFDISKAMPGIFPAGTYVKRKVTNPMVSFMAGAMPQWTGIGVNNQKLPTPNIPTGPVGGTPIKPVKDATATIVELNRKAKYDGEKWVFEDDNTPVPAKYL